MLGRGFFWRTDQRLPVRRDDPARRPSVAGGAAWAVMAGTYTPMPGYYRQSLWLVPLLPLTAVLYLLMTVSSAVQHHRGLDAAWKGRTYARPVAAPEP